ncbi:MAG: FAD-dependent oxidoreductase [Desulfamplus sp.]|nr:FAD-dependent oxidoreductase [Desulfamplus sp.]
MPYNIADPARDMNDLVVRKADEFRTKNKINLMTGHMVNRIDTATKTVSGIIFSDIIALGSNSSVVNTDDTHQDVVNTCDARQDVVNTDDARQDFSYSYDKLLIATGATPVIPDLPGFDLPGVMPLKNLEQGRKIKAFIEKNNVQKAVIIGMGYIGLEMCEALRARSIQVTMVKPGSQFLPWMKPELADFVKQELDANGIKLCYGKIKKIEHQSSSKHTLSVVCENFTLDADMVIVASGVKPCSDLAIAAGLKVSVANSIAVDKTLKTSNDNIYAAGDCADAFNVVSGEKCWIPLALRANRAGWAVADNVCGIKTELQGVAGTAVFKMFDLQITRTGLSVKEALASGFDPVEVIIQTRSKAHGHPGSNTIHVAMTGDKRTGLLLGVQMVGKDGVAHRINAPAVALHAKMTVAEFAQTDLGYAPPFGPVWDPVLTAANQLLKKM